MADQVRAKFKCTEKAQRQGYAGHEFFWAYRFQVVTSGSPENDAFFASTPGGTVELSAVADDLFQVGKQYYLDFVAAN